MQILSNTLAFVFALGVIVFVHEAGHYLVAKAFGVRVLTFSLGFGRSLWSTRRGETEYRVSWIPLGGYVNYAGQDPSEQSSNPRDFQNQARWRRVLILVAGPAMNVVLAIALVAVVFATGVAVGDPDELPAVLGAVEEGGAAERSGLQTADRIVRIDGEDVSSWQDFAFAILTSPERPLRLDYERPSESGTVETGTVELKPDKTPRDEVGEAGVYPLVMIGEVIEGSAAQEAGFRAGDAVLTIDGNSIRGFADLRDKVVDRPGQELVAELLRGEQRIFVTVVPRRNADGQVMIGVGQTVKEYTVGEALVESVRFNAEVTAQILTLIRKLLERRISLKASLGGPIEIAAVSGEAARQGFRSLFLIMAFISINLFIFNLLPIPILDGGQIFILLVESTLRRDLSLRLKEVITQVGLVMIVMLMAMALYFDLSKNLPSVLSPGAESGTETPSKN